MQTHSLNAEAFAALGGPDLVYVREITAAEALGQTRDVGAIAVGRYGDMVAVQGDPLADVATLEKPVAVIKGGVPVKLD